MKFSVGESLRLMRETWPFLVFRVAVYFGIAVAYVLATGTGAGIGWTIGIFGSDEFQAGAAAWGGAIGFGGLAAVLYFLREYTLYLVKAGHVAVMVEALEARLLPEGKGQIAFAQGIVRDRFGEASALFAVDQIVKGVIRAVTGLIGGLASLLPLPAVDGAVKLLRAYLRVAVGLLDEVVLAHALRKRADDPWASAEEALVLYAQNARAMLVAAAWVALLTWGLALVVFVLMLGPAAALVWLMPGAWSAGGFVFALIFAWAAKVAVIEPFAIACLMQVYFNVTAGQVPDPDWTAKLRAASGKFRTLGARAAALTETPEPQRVYSSRDAGDATADPG